MLLLYVLCGLTVLAEDKPVKFAKKSSCATLKGKERGDCFRKKRFPPSQQAATLRMVQSADPTNPLPTWFLAHQADISSRFVEKFAHYLPVYHRHLARFRNRTAVPPTEPPKISSSEPPVRDTGRTRPPALTLGHHLNTTGCLESDIFCEHHVRLGELRGQRRADTRGA